MHGASAGPRRVSARNHSPDAEPGEVLPPGARLVSLVDEFCSPNWELLSPAERYEACCAACLSRATA
eukprot:8958218-Alexandrium_andersonii.AAC.1